MYKYLIRPLFFRLKPEIIHNLLVFILRIIQNNQLLYSVYCLFLPKVKDQQLKREVCGIQFDNAIGLAAGLDKNAEVIDAFAAMGFGHIEIGTVTPVAQPGNPKPRLFRIVKDKALINRMGFNNHGAEQTIRNLKKRKSKAIVGGNIGKNKITPNENAVDDYEKTYEALYPYVDYFVVNVSSPNTPDLRELQDKKPLSDILSHLKALSAKKEPYKPILLKVAPDLSNSQIDDVVEIVTELKIDGIVATNTTIGRSGLSISPEKIKEIGDGGLSGKPLTTRSTEIIRYIHDKTKGTVPIIGVGGIMTAEDALDKLKAGASLVQLYTGFIYEGPALIRKINRAMLKADIHQKKTIPY